MRHADAGYVEARVAAEKHGVRIPMPSSGETRG
jgi:hypothetical protein